jgi:hypothetical protein
MRGGRGRLKPAPMLAWRRALLLMLAVCGLALGAGAPALASGAPPVSFEVESQNGSNNNLTHAGWGEAGSRYVRLAPARYGDGVGTLAAGPNPRYVSNRIFNSGGQDLFSPRNLSQWVWVWGQYVDHTVGRAQEGSEEASIPFSSSDPLESFTDTLGSIPFTRNAVAPGTGTGPGNPRQQINTVNSYIDNWSLYGGSPQRLEWMRVGPDKGEPAKASARLLLPDKFLPLASARGNPATAPSMLTEGALAGEPQNAVVAGDVRANENAQLTALTTLFAREHNRIVGHLPSSLSNEERFQIARRIVAAEEQYITYNEFLPAVGVTLSPYAGYDPNVNAELSDEFATVAYRAHSMVNGEEHVEVKASEFNSAKLEGLEAMGIDAEPGAKKMLVLTIPQGAAFFDPAIIPAIGLAPILKGLTDEAGYANDEQIDDALRSVLFEIPAAGTEPASCFEDAANPGCFSAVEDLGAVDVQRARDNGIPAYNELRTAVGLPAQHTFAEVTGESSEQFPTEDPLIPPTNAIEDPHILDVSSLKNFYGEPVVPGSHEHAVSETRRTTLAARLKAIYGSVDNLDAFVGMMSEPHPSGSELGELQSALWRGQFEALRNGDRFFYAGDPVLHEIAIKYGITYRHTLSELIEIDGKVAKKGYPANVFFAPEPKHLSAQARRRAERLARRVG